MPLGLVDQSSPEAGLLRCPNFERTIFRAITDKTVDYVIEELRSLGYDRTSFSALDPNARDSFDFRDIEFDAVCKHETYQGNQKERWEFKRGMSDVTPLEVSEVSKLDALFGKKLIAGKPAGSPQRSATAQSTPLPEKSYAGGEEIPF